MNPIGVELLPVKPGSASVPVPGYEVQVLDDDGKRLDSDEIGAIVIKLPLPPGSLPTLWNADDRYIDSYLSTFPGYYLTADAGYKDADGYIYIMSRIDDIYVISLRGFLESYLRSWRQRAVHRSHRLSSDQTGRPGGKLHRCLRSLRFSNPVSSRRTMRP